MTSTRHPGSPSPINDEPPESAPRSRRFRRIAIGMALVSLVPILALVSNSVSLSSPSRADVQAQMDHAIDLSTTWLSTHKDVFGNPPLMFMVIDMERMSKDRRLTALVDAYRHSEYTNAAVSPARAVWARMADSGVAVPDIDLRRAPTDDINELVWDAYAVAPNQVRISDVQREHMFSTNRYFWGRRNHQLLALDMYRYFNGRSPELDGSMHRMAELVIRDQYIDVRMNDSYPQRIAFALGASRPDLIRPRWVERMLSNQNSDGSWNYCWHHWCKGVFEFKREDTNQVHTTPQAMWALYMLKYRFPDWVAQHYH